MKEQEISADLKPVAVASDEPAAPPDSRAAARHKHLTAVAAEADRLSKMDWPTLSAELREVIARRRKVSTEALVRICRQAHQAGHRAKLNLAFEAASITATPLLLARARAAAPDERQDEAQEVLLELFKAISTGKSELAETFFAAFAKRRSIDLFRRRLAQFEGKHSRAEPVGDLDPLDTVPARGPSAEARALLAVAIDKLPPKPQAAFIQRHRLGMTQKEIARQHGVDVRTVYNWLSEARGALGLQGDDNDC